MTTNGNGGSNDESLVSLSRAFGVPAVDLDWFAIPTEIIRLIPRADADACKAIPIALAEETLIVAMADPSDDTATARLAQVTGYKIEVVVASTEQIAAALAKHYGDEP